MASSKKKAPAKQSPKTPLKRGPKPQRLVIAGDWKDAIDKVLKGPPPKRSA